MTNLSGSGGRSIGVNYATSAKNMGECFLTCKIHHSHDKFENAFGNNLSNGYRFITPFYISNADFLLT